MFCVRFVGRIASAALAAALAGCATAPRSGSEPFTINELRICPGMAIANPPPAAGGGLVADYSPVTIVRGSMLARAPVDACVSSGFGPRTGGAGAFHEGVDLFTRTPKPVLAGGDGRIAWVKTVRGYGLAIEITHGRGVSTRYAHLSSAAAGLRAGSLVKAGDVIGRSGNSGNATAIHLHYEILVDGQPRNPLTVGD